MEEQNLRIRFATHINSLYSILIVAVLFAFGLYYFFNFEKSAVIICGIFFIVDAIPALYLHFDYWRRNYGEQYEIKESEIIRKRENIETVIKANEIKKIEIYLSPSLYKNSYFHLLSVESYHYAIIRLKNGEELVLTSLLAFRLDRELMKIKGVLFDKQKQLFCAPTRETKYYA